MEDEPKHAGRVSKVVLIAIIIVLVVIVIGGMAYMVGRFSSISLQMLPRAATPSPVHDVMAPTPDRILETAPLSPEVADWETYTDDAYTFKHPADIPSDTDGAGSEYKSIRFRYMGPTQSASGRTQTSLFDGYSFMIIHIGPGDEASVSRLANERHTNSTNNCNPEAKISSIQMIKVGGEVGAQYSVVGCMGDFTSTYVAHDGTVYEIVQYYTGDPVSQEHYKTTTDQMLSTLKFN